MTESCATCRFWKPLPNPTKGECHRFPAVVPDRVSGDVLGHMKPVWPWLGENDWCGEYAAKPEPYGCDCAVCRGAAEPNTP